jgi:hypothetical protein
MARHRVRDGAGCELAGAVWGCGCGGASRGVDGPVITSKSKLDAGMSDLLGVGGRSALAY